MCDTNLHIPETREAEQKKNNDRKTSGLAGI